MGHILNSLKKHEMRKIASSNERNINTKEPKVHFSEFTINIMIFIKF